MGISLKIFLAAILTVCLAFLVFMVAYYNKKGRLWKYERNWYRKYMKHKKTDIEHNDKTENVV